MYTNNNACISGHSLRTAPNDANACTHKQGHPPFHVLGGATQVTSVQRAAAGYVHAEFSHKQ